MSKLLDDSLDSFIELRKRQKNEKVNIIKMHDVPYTSVSFNQLFRVNPTNTNERNETNNNGHTNRLANRLARLERIRNMQEETENLERLIENDIEIIG